MYCSQPFLSKLVGLAGVSLLFPLNSLNNLDTVAYAVGSKSSNSEVFLFMPLTHTYTYQINDKRTYYYHRKTINNNINNND